MTALANMATARPPGIADARVPCPLCGGLIHPVAGRCKHCKEDLTSFRAGRPQAAAALPPLGGPPPVPNGTNGHAAAAAIPVAMPAREGSQPILPPRTTTRSLPVARPRAAWRSWPMLVIALAAIAIVAATVILIMPPGERKRDGKMSSPPAPERMDVNPLPDQHDQIDPWGEPGTVPHTPDPLPTPPPSMPPPAPPQPQMLYPD